MTSGPEAIVALIANDQVVAEERAPGARGLAETLPRMVEAVAGPGYDLLAVVAGPGSFTGIRAGLALGHGLALGAGVPLVAVTMGEALEAANGEALVVATDAGRGRVFVEHAGRCSAVAAADAVVVPTGLRVAGDAAHDVAGPLAARLLPQPADVARAALARHAGRLPPRMALPLYVDDALVSAPRDKPRPPPAG